MQTNEKNRPPKRYSSGLLDTAPFITSILCRYSNYAQKLLAHCEGKFGKPPKVGSLSLAFAFGNRYPSSPLRFDRLGAEVGTTSE